MKSQLSLRLLLATAVAATFLSWEKDGPLPPEPDYAQASQWYMKQKGGAVDLFYIISTEVSDDVQGGDTCHYADTYNHSRCRRMHKEMTAVDSLFGGQCNYYSPYYRQVSMDSWADESVALRRLPVALADVRRSWEFYLRHFNQGRPFVLAGYSQGAHAMLDILKHMPDSLYRRMVAAYAIGYRITQETLDSFPQVRPAQGATDVGVTIGYNSVRSPECAIPVVSGGNVVCINPVNWRTDTVKARFLDSLTVHCDPESHLLIVEGFRERRVMPVIGRRGNYHNRELKFYYPYIRQNIADRVQAYFRRDSASAQP